MYFSNHPSKQISLYFSLYIRRKLSSRNLQPCCFHCPLQGKKQNITETNLNYVQHPPLSNFQAFSISSPSFFSFYYIIIYTHIHIIQFISYNLYLSIYNLSFSSILLTQKDQELKYIL